MVSAKPIELNGRVYNSGKERYYYCKKLKNRGMRNLITLRETIHLSPL